jgi:RimJ/RimL family protein N-acetyltransferase
MNDTILETERLLLRYQRDEDLEFIIKLWTDEDITKYVGGPRNKNDLIKNNKNISKNQDKEEYDLWIVEIKKTKESIGHAGIIPKEIENEIYYEINYFFNKEYWGHGYATEIAEEIIKHMKHTKKINEYITIIDKNNIASINVAKKIGMKY